MQGEGYCECGCGQLAPIAPQNHARYGWVEGRPLRFARGHSTRRKGPDYLPEDRGYETPCWVWQGSDDGDGYGTVRRDRRTLKAHRFYYEQVRGPIPDGLQLDHLCRIRRCVNPAHLEPVTQAENMQRGVQARKKARLA